MDKNYVKNIVKYLFSIVLIVLSFITTKNVRFIIVGILELMLILSISNVLVNKNKVIGRIINDVFLLLFNIQMIVLYFSNTFIQTVMLSNLSSLDALSGKLLEYSFGVICVIIFSFIPVEAYKNNINLFIPIGAYLISLFLCGINYSPSISYVTLIRQKIAINKMQQKVLGLNEEASEFYNDEIGNYIDKDENLSSKPNVILIFTEGLSQNIVDDSRQIMPNLKEFEKSSIFFDNYYNHTFATYRGISGSLYSGYQLNNTDVNNLISIQKVMGVMGYYTAFINTEPNNVEFSEYLKNLRFDEVIGDTRDEMLGPSDSYSDKQAYEMLYNKALELTERNENFFLCIYTFGTHVSLDTVDELYGDGSDPILNKFYNLDVQFGDFIKKFNESEISNNTIVVFTADHATYQDEDFVSTFPNYQRASTMVDTIPLCIYYKGINSDYYDANGRNSLALAPTILDYLDISTPNYFLGTSLFSNEYGDFDTLFNEEAFIYQTNNNNISSLNNDEFKRCQEKMFRYFAIKEKGTDASVLETLQKGSDIETSIEGEILSVCLKSESDYDAIYFPIWSSIDGQDDLCWYKAELNEKGEWEAKIDLNMHTLNGELIVEAYQVKEGESLYLCRKIIIVDVDVVS